MSKRVTVQVSSFDVSLQLDGKAICIVVGDGVEKLGKAWLSLEQKRKLIEMLKDAEQ